MKTRDSILALIIPLAVGGGLALADITGSGHDFSGSGWGSTEICIFCHTPHNAGTPQPAPLWNHQSTAAAYTVYSSPTMHQTPRSRRATGRKCASPATMEPSPLTPSAAALEAA